MIPKDNKIKIINMLKLVFQFHIILFNKIIISHAMNIYNVHIIYIENSICECDFLQTSV